MIHEWLAGDVTTWLVRYIVVRQNYTQHLPGVVGHILIIRFGVESSWSMHRSSPAVKFCFAVGHLAVRPSDNGQQ